LKFYTPVEASETAYLLDAVLWVALGRVPECMYDFRGNDVRGDLEKQDDCYMSPELEMFTEQEFEAIGHPIDYNRYFDAAVEDPGFHDREMMSEHFKKVPIGLGFKEKPSDQDVENVAFVERCNRLFGPLMERAKVSIIGDLMSGNLAATGLFASKDWEPDWSDYEIDLPERMAIREDAWNLDGIDWAGSALIDGASKYLLVCLTFEDVANRYPSPFIGGTELTADRFGDTICVMNANASRPAPVKRGRGRPPKASGSIKSVVRNVFAERIRRGGVPEKNEALYQEVIEFVETAFGEDISRSTAQSYVRDLLPDTNRKSAGN